MKLLLLTTFFLGMSYETSSASEINSYFDSEEECGTWRSEIVNRVRHKFLVVGSAPEITIDCTKMDSGVYKGRIYNKEVLSNQKLEQIESISESFQCNDESQKPKTNHGGAR